MKGIYWARNDLRLHDNLSLNAFLQECSEGIVLWCPTKSSQRAGIHRDQFREDSLFHFDVSLQKIGQKLHIGTKDIHKEIQEIIEQYAFLKIYFTSLYGPEEKQDEENLIYFCQKNNILCQSFDQETLIQISDLPFTIENMPFVFSDFRRKVESNLIIKNSIPLTLQRNKPAENFAYQNKLAPHPHLLFHSGEKAALQRLAHYFGESKAILTYKETRNGMLNDNDSSRLSPWQSLGILSPRMIMQQLRFFEEEYQSNESTYWLFFELLWRDYLKIFSRKFKQNIYLENGVKRGKHYSPIKNHQLNKDWCNGKTPEPFINANMNELNQTGWMSNRGRQNVASFLVHGLKIPWTWGAAYFEKQLIDYDCELNWGNWLYLSGNGSDPRARMFNCKRQAEMYDPEFLYQKKWLDSL